MPKEVGKVGTESSTFIEPISSRKDGIQAMFSKQKLRASQSQQASGSSPVRRKRSRSASPLQDVIDLTLDDQPEAKKAKVEDDDVGPTSKIVCHFLHYCGDDSHVISACTFFLRQVKGKNVSLL